MSTGGQMGRCGMQVDRSRSLRVLVVVLNYRTPDLVEDCLRSLDGQLVPGERELVVVDNASGDDSADRIEAAIERHGWSAWARVVRSPVNDGFAAGNNIGVRSCNADIYVLLNSDTVVREGALDLLAAAVCGSAAIAGPRLEWPTGERQVSTFRFRTPLTELISSGRLGSLGRLFQGHVVARELDDAASDLDWVSFACVAIRGEVFERIGGLDERYFMYFEDMDFCRRACGVGFGVGYEPAARVVHLRGGTSEVKRNTEGRRRRPAYFYAARAHYFRKWYGIGGLILANLLWTSGWALAVIRGKSAAVEREWLDIWSSNRSLGSMRGSRRDVGPGLASGVSDG